jgi:hypothetical protein
LVKHKSRVSADVFNACITIDAAVGARANLLCRLGTAIKAPARS